MTLVRAGATLWLVLPACGPGLLAASAWVPFLVGVALLLLDGVDGRLARASVLASAFGGRLDLEVDAALILALAALVCTSGRAGAWVLAAGLLRYVFLAAGRLWGWMHRPLPPSGASRALLGHTCAVCTTLSSDAGSRTTRPRRIDWTPTRG